MGQDEPNRGFVVDVDISWVSCQDREEMQEVQSGNLNLMGSC